MGKLARARLDLVEQPRVLDRNHCLVGEGGHQRDLLAGEWPHLGAAYPDNTQGFALPQQGNAQASPETEPDRHRAADGELGGVGLKIVDMDRLTIDERAPVHPVAPDRQTDEVQRDWAVMCPHIKPLAFAQENNRVVRVAQPTSALSNGLQHRLNVSG
jgi:hypothetical protein